ncbi:helix-turn-helix domain-containing protein [Bacillus thuringiensis]|nr:helix-turn-helix domain-containing protein [Bacillus thuringiensis]
MYGSDAPSAFGSLLHLSLILYISHIAKENGITRQTVYKIKHAMSS